MIQFIGLAGQAFSGKTTVAGMMAGMIPGVVIRPIAFYLKATAVSLGWDGVKDERGRRLLQGLGQVLREYNPESWVDYWSRHVEAIAQDKRNMTKAVIIADDVRYDNEAGRILDLGGQVIRVARLGGPTLGNGLGDHPSENGLTAGMFPRMGGLVNDSGLDSLEGKVRRIVSDLKQGLDLAGKTW